MCWEALPGLGELQGEARKVKLGGFSAPTQDVSGTSGSARNDTITAWAQVDQGATKCPIPGMLTIVALVRLAARPPPRRGPSRHRSCPR